MKTWITRILLAFVVFTLGFGFGREAGLRRSAASPGSVDGTNEPPVPGEDKVIVHYMHTTFRCVTCNAIERMAREVVETDFAEALAGGRIEWREVDFQERDDLAQRYDVASSCVVIADVRDGVEADFRRLDDVWTLSDRPDAFAEYVAGAIRAYLDAPQAP